MSRGSKRTLYDRIRLILESARSGVARTVNTTQVTANWLIGREIVEEEQQGSKRAGYGQQVVEELAERLGGDFGKGFAKEIHGVEMRPPFLSSVYGYL